MRRGQAFLLHGYLLVCIRVFPLAALDIRFCGPCPYAQGNPTSAARLNGQLRVLSRIPARAQTRRASWPWAALGLRGLLFERLSRPHYRFSSLFPAPWKTICRKANRRLLPRLFRLRARSCRPENPAPALFRPLFPVPFRPLLPNPVPAPFRSRRTSRRGLLFYLPFSPFRGVEKLYPHACK